MEKILHPEHRHRCGGGGSRSHHTAMTGTASGALRDGLRTPHRQTTREWKMLLCGSDCDEGCTPRRLWWWLVAMR